MNEDTRLEVIKALVYGVDKEEIANMADVENVSEIDAVEKEYAKDIKAAKENMRVLEGEV